MIPKVDIFRCQVPQNNHGDIFCRTYHQDESIEGILKDISRESNGKWEVDKITDDCQKYTGDNKNDLNN